MLSNGKLGKKVVSLVSNYSDEESNDDNTTTEEGEEEERNEVEAEEESLVDENKFKSEQNDDDSNSRSVVNELNEEKSIEFNSNNEKQQTASELIEQPKDDLQLTLENGFHMGCVNIQLPLATNEQCSQKLQEKIAKVHARMTQFGYNINDDIQNNKKFKNPSIYEKLIEHYDIDEFGSSFPSYVPDLKQHGYLFYDELDEIQRQEWAKRDKDRKEKTTRAEIVSGIKRTKM